MLLDIQRLVAKLITAPEGVASGLDQLSPPELQLWDGLLRGSSSLSAVERLDIYANMYFFRLRDSLAEDFPAVSAVMGATRFHNLVTDYLLAHRPAHYSLRYAGRHLPEFLRRWSPGADWPFLADLAALEWAVLEAFDAADTESIGREVLATVPAEDWPHLRFELSPSLQLLELDWAVHTLWSDVQAGRPPQSAPSAATHLRVWRQNLRVYQSPIATAEYAALQAMRTGASFERVCDAAAVHLGAEETPREISRLLGIWLGEGLLVGAIDEAG